MTPDLDPDLVERMVAHLRRVAKWDGFYALGIDMTEARAIVALLPEPVDPDEAEARKIASSVARKVGATNAARQIEEGIAAPGGPEGYYARTNRAFVETALAAIKRGRALASASGEGR